MTTFMGQYQQIRNLQKRYTRRNTSNTSHYRGARSAQRSPITLGNSSNPSSRKILTCNHKTDRTRYYFQYARPTALRALSQPLRNEKAREKVIRRRDCVGNLDTWISVFRRQQQMPIVEGQALRLRTASTRSGITRGLHAGQWM